MPAPGPAVTSRAHPDDPQASNPPPASASPEAPIPADWQRSLAAWLAAHKTYPEEARRANVQGGVVLRFNVDRSGRVVDVVLLQSAGSALLDAAAEAMLHNALLPPFPRGMSQDSLTVTVRIRYAMTD